MTAFVVFDEAAPGVFDIWTSSSDEYGNHWEAARLLAIQDTTDAMRRQSPIVKLVSPTLGYIAYLNYVGDDDVRPFRVNVLRIERFSSTNPQWIWTKTHETPDQVLNVKRRTGDSTSLSWRDEWALSFDVGMGDKPKVVHLYAAYRYNSGGRSQLEAADVLDSGDLRNPDTGAASWRVRSTGFLPSSGPGDFQPSIFATFDANTVGLNYYSAMSDNSLRRMGLWSEDALNGFVGVFDLSPVGTSGTAEAWQACPSDEYYGDYTGGAFVPGLEFELMPGIPTPHMIDGYAVSRTVNCTPPDQHVRSVVW